MAVQVDTPMIEEICMDNEQDVKLYEQPDIAGGN
jgi:hypothetical protein